MTNPTVRAQLDQFLETVNEKFYIDSLESSHPSFYAVAPIVGRKYIKIIRSSLMSQSENVLTANDRSTFMFIDRETGACYKPANHQAPAKGVRYQLEDLVDGSKVDPYGGFLYR